MLGTFNIPSVDHLREGVDYRVVDWDFAAQQPSGQGCEEGEKMVFGVCRKLKSGTSRDEKDFDPTAKSKQEQSLEAEASKQGSTFQTNKAVTTGGKKYGWAMKGGKPVMVEWGSVAGTKPKAAAPAPAAAPASGLVKGETGPAKTGSGLEKERNLSR